MQRILILGGSGFIGSHVCALAGSLGARLTVATRRLGQAQALRPLPWVDVVELDPHDGAALAAALQGHDAVLNLIAILHGREADFERVHVALPRTLVGACRQAGVERLVHVSALGAAPDAPSLYQRSKARGEAVLRESGLSVSMLCPSVVFGQGDAFLSLFARLQRWLPLMPLAGADARFQPVWVGDVARALVALLRVQPERAQARLPARSLPQRIEACGPEVFTLRELVRLAGRWSGHERPVIGLGPALAGLQARVMELMPGPTLMSRDNLASLSVDNVATPGQPGLEALGIVPTSLHAIGPQCLAADGADPALEQRRRVGMGRGR